jgi:hypothetical protein
VERTGRNVSCVAFRRRLRGPIKDGARTFSGSAAGSRIEFRRDGVTESIEATNGDATGMKWLAGKTSCLTIKLGEGYCRD